LRELKKVVSVMSRFGTVAGMVNPSITLAKTPMQNHRFERLQTVFAEGHSVNASDRDKVL
jgi:hypothetical protein